MNRLREYFRGNSLFSKMYAGILLSMLASACGTYLYIAHGQKELLRSNLLSQGRNSSHLLAENIKLHVYAGDVESITGALSHFLDQNDDIAALVLRPDLSLFAQALNPANMGEVTVDFLRSTPRDLKGLGAENSLVEEREGAFVFWRPITTAPADDLADLAADRVHGADHGRPIGYLALIKSKPALESATAALAGKTSLILAGFFILATLSTLLLVGVTTRPLRRLVESLRRRHRGVDPLPAGAMPDSAYSRLIEEIEEAFARMSNFNEELAKKVAERTADLNLANRELENRVAQRTKEVEEKHRELLHVVKLTTAGKMLASIAHEVNTPLCAIKMSLEEFKAEGGLDAERSALLDEVLHECDRVAALVRNLRMSTLPPSALETRYDLHELLDSVFMLASRNFRSAGITLVRDYAPDCNFLTGCPDQLFLVFMNLAQNAADAMAPHGGGVLTVATNFSADCVRISFSDTGEGISPENREKIFEPFFTTKSEVKGTGLGLSISLGIVQSHGGTIEIGNGKGSGAVVTVVLPVVDKILA